jgi:hypothetical protein
VSLTALVVQAIQQRGTATIEDLLPLFPEASRKQVHDALCNARDRKKIRMKVRGNAKAKRLGIWEPAPDAVPDQRPRNLDKRYPLRPPASVWDLGAEQPRLQWPPIAAGRRFEPLGSWSAE